MGESLFFISVYFHFTLGLIFHAKTVTVFMQVELSQFMIEFAKKKTNQKKNQKQKQKNQKKTKAEFRLVHYGTYFFHSK